MANTLNNTDQIPSNAILRLIFVVMFNLINMVVSKVLLLVAVYQFLCHLLTGRVTQRGVRWGEAISNWTYQMMLFMTYKTERMPFPFHRLGAGSNED